MSSGDEHNPTVKKIYKKAQKLDFAGAKDVIRAATEKADLMPRDKNRYTLGLLFQAAVEHDPDTAGHVARVSIIAGTLAELAGKPSNFQEELAYSSPPHDIGKMATPDHILHKRGSFDKDEWVLMRKHVGHGYQLLHGIEGLETAAQIALHHHHKFNGCQSGYPGNISGNQIPEAAQFFPIADIYDALRSERPYKTGMTHEQAMDVILNGDSRTKPAHFNPDILDVLRSNGDKIKALYEQMQGNEVTMALNPDGILMVQDNRVQKFSWVNDASNQPSLASQPIIQVVEDPFLKMLRDVGGSSEGQKQPSNDIYKSNCATRAEYSEQRKMQQELARYRHRLKQKKERQNRRDL